MVTLNDLVQGLSHGSPEQKATTGIVDSELRNCHYHLSCVLNLRSGNLVPLFLPKFLNPQQRDEPLLTEMLPQYKAATTHKIQPTKCLPAISPTDTILESTVSVQKSFTHDVYFRCNFGISGSKGCLAYLFHRSNLPSLSTLVYLRLTTLWRFFRTNSPKMELQICGMFFVDLFLYQD